MAKQRTSSDDFPTSYDNNYQPPSHCELHLHCSHALLAQGVMGQQFLHRYHHFLLHLSPIEHHYLFLLPLILFPRPSLFLFLLPLILFPRPSLFLFLLPLILFPLSLVLFLPALFHQILAFQACRLILCTSSSGSLMMMKII